MRTTSCTLSLALLLAAACQASAITGYHVKEAVVRNSPGWYDCGLTCRDVLGSRYTKLNGGNTDTAVCGYSKYYGVKTAPPNDNTKNNGCAVPYYAYVYPSSTYNCLCTDDSSKLSWTTGKSCPKTFPYVVSWYYPICRFSSGGRYWLGYLDGLFCKAANMQNNSFQQKSVLYTSAQVLCSKP